MQIINTNISEIETCEFSVFNKPSVLAMITYWSCSSRTKQLACSPSDLM